MNQPYGIHRCLFSPANLAAGVTLPLAPEPKLVGEVRTRLGVIGGDHRVFRGKAPLGTVFVRGQAVRRLQMPLEHLQLLAVLKADDVVGESRLLDRNGRLQLNLTRALGVHTIVSLNPVMIDGTGMCGGCRVSLGQEIKFACVDGPEFDGHLVNFDELQDRLSTYREFEQRSTACAAGTCRMETTTPSPA